MLPSAPVNIRIMIATKQWQVPNLLGSPSLKHAEYISYLGPKFTGENELKDNRTKRQKSLPTNKI